jgi:hypothetical protein
VCSARQPSARRYSSFRWIGVYTLFHCTEVNISSIFATCNEGNRICFASHTRVTYNNYVHWKSHICLWNWRHYLECFISYRLQHLDCYYTLYPLTCPTVKNHTGSDLANKGPQSPLLIILPPKHSVITHRIVSGELIYAWNNNGPSYPSRTHSTPHTKFNVI